MTKEEAKAATEAVINKQFKTTKAYMSKKGKQTAIDLAEGKKIVGKKKKEQKSKKKRSTAEKKAPVRKFRSSMMSGVTKSEVKMMDERRKLEKQQADKDLLETRQSIQNIKDRIKKEKLESRSQRTADTLRGKGFATYGSLFEEFVSAGMSKKEASAAAEAVCKKILTSHSGRLTRPAKKTAIDFSRGKKITKRKVRK